MPLEPGQQVMTVRTPADDDAAMLPFGVTVLPPIHLEHEVPEAFKPAMLTSSEGSQYSQETESESSGNQSARGDTS